MKSGSGGTALPIVLWALIALGSLSAIASVTAILDLSLTRNHQDYAAALALAEAGLADALAAVASDPMRASRPDSLVGGLETGAYRARWEASGVGLHVQAEGTRQAARRTVEAWVSSNADDALRITGWREVR